MYYNNNLTKKKLTIKVFRINNNYSSVIMSSGTYTKIKTVFAQLKKIYLVTKSRH